MHSVDLVRLRPAPADGTPAVSYKPSQPSGAGIATRSKGGRLPRDDWEEFDAEAFRIAAEDGEHISRTDLKRRMKG